MCGNDQERYLRYCQKYRPGAPNRAVDTDVDVRVITDSLHMRVKTMESLKNRIFTYEDRHYKSQLER